MIKDNLTQISKSKSNLQTNYNSEVDLKNKNNLTENNIFTNLIKESSIKTFSQNLEIVLTSEFSLFSIYDTILNNLKSINNDKNPLENSDTNLVSNAILKNKIFKKCNFTNIDKRNQIINMISKNELNQNNNFFTREPNKKISSEIDLILDYPKKLNDIYKSLKKFKQLSN